MHDDLPKGHGERASSAVGRAALNKQPLTCSCDGGCVDGAVSRLLRNRLSAAAKGFLAVAGRSPNGFCCPLCLRELPETCATSAHGPAEGIGGRAVGVLCRRCNSFIGTAYESHALDLIRSVPRDGRQTLTMRVGRTGGPLTYHRGVLERAGPKEWRLEGDPIGTIDKYVLDDLRAHPGHGLTITFRLPTEKPLRLALLSWAHLALFSRFGYVFALSKAARAVRKSIVLGTQPFGGASILFRGEVPHQMREITVGIMTRALGDHPGSGVSFFALGVTFQDAVDVCIPLASDPEGDLIRELFAASENGRFGFPVRNVPLDVLFEEARGRTYVDTTCSFALAGDAGDETTIVRTTRDEAAESLANPTPPQAMPRRRRAPRRPPDGTSPVGLG